MSFTYTFHRQAGLAHSASKLRIAQIALEHHDVTQPRSARWICHLITRTTLTTHTCGSLDNPRPDPSEEIRPRCRIHAILLPIAPRQTVLVVGHRMTPCRGLIGDRSSSRGELGCRCLATNEHGVGSSATPRIGSSALSAQVSASSSRRNSPLLVSIAPHRPHCVRPESVLTAVPTRLKNSFTSCRISPPDMRPRVRSRRYR